MKASEIIDVQCSCRARIKTYVVIQAGCYYEVEESNSVEV